MCIRTAGVIRTNRGVHRMVWDQNNFLMACSTPTNSGTDKNSRDGIYDMHAYGILQVKKNVAGTNFDLIQVHKFYIYI